MDMFSSQIILIKVTYWTEATVWTISTVILFYHDPISTGASEKQKEINTLLKFYGLQNFPFSNLSNYKIISHIYDLISHMFELIIHLYNLVSHQFINEIGKAS